jgi:hypothetical protein
MPTHAILVPSAARRTRLWLGCVALAIAFHAMLLWLHSVRSPETTRDATALFPLTVRIVPKPAIVPAPVVEEAPTAVATPPKQRGPRRGATPAATRPIDSLKPSAPAGIAQAVDDQPPVTLPGEAGTRRLLSDLDRQERRVAAQRERLEFPVRDHFGDNPLGKSIADTAREDCSDQLRHPSILGLLSMARDTLRNKGCKW